MCHARSTVHYTNCFGRALVGSKKGGEIHILSLDLYLLKWLRTNLPEGTFISLCCVLQLWLQVLELGASLSFNRSAIWTVSFVWALLAFVFFFPKRLFFVSTGRNNIMIHTFSRADDYVHLVWLACTAILLLLSPRIPAWWTYVHTYVRGQTGIYILQSHPASK